ncbi:uncharacterized protein LOC131024701 isoform X2 [Salvia miltiorrhiza]|uniref:uncharacterized protein LOC131024701 isoform X2 n=1 Tax=Salvia miltiorrhiza TaxID=226208 RepID=UPI0025AB947A|nr:uncharacterized protein LOC131024701 isoform X2 [Salvia miltiorrhiza]
MLERIVGSRVSSTGQTTLTITSHGAIYPYNVVPSACTRIFKKVRNPRGFNWKLTPETVKKNYFNEFKKHFTWDATINDAIYKLWLEIAARRYKDFVYEIKAKRDDPENARPLSIHKDEWPEWLAYWETDAFKLKSEKAKKCRMSEPGGVGTGQVKHKGGSKSVLQYADELARHKGVNPTKCLFDVYSILHVNEDGTYTDMKSESIGTKVQELVSQQSQPMELLSHKRWIWQKFTSKLLVG